MRDGGRGRGRAREGGGGRERAGEGGGGREKIRTEYVTFKLKQKTGRRGREREGEGRHLLGPHWALSFRAPVLRDICIVALQACTTRLVSMNIIQSNHRLQGQGTLPCSTSTTVYLFR